MLKQWKLGWKTALVTIFHPIGSKVSDWKIASMSALIRLNDAIAECSKLIYLKKARSCIGRTVCKCFHTISNLKLQQKLKCRQNIWRRASSDKNLNERPSPRIECKLLFCYHSNVWWKKTWKVWRLKEKFENKFRKWWKIQVENMKTPNKCIFSWKHFISGTCCWAQNSRRHSTRGWSLPTFADSEIPRGKFWWTNRKLSSLFAFWWCWWRL